MSVSPHAGVQDCCVRTPAQQKVVALLSAGATIAAAARAAGVHRNTVTNWRRQPAIQAAITQASQTKENLWRDETDAVVLLKAALAILERPAPIPAAQAGETVQAMHNSAQSREAIGFVSPISVGGGDAISPRSALVHPNDSPAQIHAHLPPSPGTIVQPAHHAAQGPETRQTSAIPACPKPQPPGPKIGRNHPCPCGSGKKFKRCCFARQVSK